MVTVVFDGLSCHEIGIRDYGILYVGKSPYACEVQYLCDLEGFHLRDVASAALKVAFLGTGIFPRSDLSRFHRLLSHWPHFVSPRTI